MFRIIRKSVLIVCVVHIVLFDMIVSANPVWAKDVVESFDDSKERKDILPEKKDTNIVQVEDVETMIPESKTGEIEKTDKVDEKLENQIDERELVKYAQSLEKAKKLVMNGKLKEAIAVYRELLKSRVLEIRIESLFQLGNIAFRIGQVNTAIKYYEKILEMKPDATRVRFELAKAHLVNENWRKAKYHFMLTAADADLPPEVQQNIAAALYYIRQNKNWHFWFNIGAAPDDNINNATEGEQCIETAFGVFCNKLPEKEKAKGLNVSFGGDYELKLSDHWRLKNEFMLWSSSYDKKKYDDLYLSYSVGPKYIWQKGDVFIGPSVYRRWLGHRPYSYAIGGVIKTDFDITQHLSLALNLSFMPTRYDKFEDELDGYTKSVSSNIFYAFDTSTYMVLRGGYLEEHTNNEIYNNNRSFYAIGLGQELPYGFSVYLEPSVQFGRYQNDRWYVKDLTFQKIKEKYVLRKYSISISNRKISLFGFMPIFTYAYTNKNSNVWQHEYEKSNFELMLQQKF